MATGLHDPQIRLDCLKLATKPGLSPREHIDAAAEYLAWVTCAADNPKGPANNAATATSAPPAADKPPTKSGAAKRQD